MRKNPEFYFRLCNDIVRAILPSSRRAWAKMVMENDFSFDTLVEASTEAFVLLLIENSYAYWQKQFEHKKMIDDIKAITAPKSKERMARMKQLQKKYEMPLQLYTSGSNTKRDQGWSNEGLQRYNALYDAVEVDRDANGDAFDQFIVAHFKSVNQSVHSVTNHDIAQEVQPVKMRFRGFSDATKPKTKAARVDEMDQEDAPPLAIAAV